MNLHWPRDSTMMRVALATFLFLHTNSAFGVLEHGTPRTKWTHEDISLLRFTEPGTFNYSTLLVQEQKGVLYVGAREAIFQLSLRNVSVLNKKVEWKVPEGDMRTCTLKGKSVETDCLNYIRVLEVMSDERLYVCGTHAFQPLCDYLSLSDFKLEGSQEDGKGKCPFDPAQSFSTVMVDGNLYSGTAYNFLGSEPIISRNGHPQGMLRTEYSTSWLNEPSFVFADVVRQSRGSDQGDDDKIYFFFTEVSVEYEFLGKLLIPRVARVCKGDLGGERTLQKRWTSFLKAKLMCFVPETNFVFNVVRDVFILRGASWRESVIYGIFSSQWGNVESSAVCSYSMSEVQKVFSGGKYMEKTTVQQSHTKWVRYNGLLPSPRPGACVSDHERQQNISSSLDLPDKTLQFVRDHPLLEDPVLPIGGSPRLVARDVLYTQIAVERVRALDGQTYDVMFTGTDKGLLHKAVVLESEVYVIEEIQLFPNSESIKTLVLPSNEARFLYVGSDSAVVQVPTAFCDRYLSCEECVLTRDPYCAWDPAGGACVTVAQSQSLSDRNLVQSLDGDADMCPKGNTTCRDYQLLWTQPGASVDLPCEIGSGAARLEWRVNGTPLQTDSRPYRHTAAGLTVYGVSTELQGCYECWAQEEVGSKSYHWLLRGFVLNLTTTTTAAPGAGREHTDVTKASSTLAPPGPTLVGVVTSPALATMVGVPRRVIPDMVAPETGSQHQQSDSSVALLLFLTLFFLILFLATLGYNCYMQYLPTPCLRVRATLLGGKKPPKSEYSACDAGLGERGAEQGRANGVQRDGWDSGLDKGGAGSTQEACQCLPTEKPFDIDCEAQAIEYADVDMPN